MMLTVVFYYSDLESCNWQPHDAHRGIGYADSSKTHVNPQLVQSAQAWTPEQVVSTKLLTLISTSSGKISIPSVAILTFFHGRCCMRLWHRNGSKMLAAVPAPFTIKVVWAACSPFFSANPIMIQQRPWWFSDFQRWILEPGFTTEYNGRR